MTMPEIPKRVRRWTAKRRSALVLTFLKGETSVAEAARQHGLTVAEVEDLRDKILLGAENALRSRSRNEEALTEGADQAAPAEGRRAGAGSRHLQGGRVAPPYRSGDARAVMAIVPGSSHRRICRVLKVSRASVEPTKVEPTSRRERPVNALLAERIWALIQRFSTFGYRRLWAWLRFRDSWILNKKTVYRVLKIKGWFVHQRQRTPRPRAQGRRSQAPASNQRWALDVTHIPCGTDGWAHLAAVIDCHDHELIGHELARRGRAREAERALEAACLRRFGTLRPAGMTPVARSDNGLTFQSRRFRAACRDYRLTQEFITPYTPEQNGMIERFFHSLKEECAWQHAFQSFAEAQTTIGRWIRFYNEQRPHQALNYQSPAQYRAQRQLQVA